jgi:hypothetical protein
LTGLRARLLRAGLSGQSFMKMDIIALKQNHNHGSSEEKDVPNGKQL